MVRGSFGSAYLVRGVAASRAQCLHRGVAASHAQGCSVAGRSLGGAYLTTSARVVPFGPLLGPSAIEPCSVAHAASAARLCTEAAGRACIVETATLCARGCNPICEGLQPFVRGVATLCARYTYSTRAPVEVSDESRSFGAAVPLTHYEELWVVVVRLL